MTDEPVRHVCKCAECEREFLDLFAGAIQCPRCHVESDELYGKASDE